MNQTRSMLTLAWILSVHHHATLHVRGTEENIVENERAAIRSSAESFCKTLHQQRIRGLPTHEQLQQLSPHLTPELIEIFNHARELQREQILRHPDEKPDWIEGDLFSSLFEGVTSWQLGDVFYSPSSDARVSVQQCFVGENEEVAKWVDTFVFKKRHGSWLLDNISMEGDWAFQPGSSLRGQLPGGWKEEDTHSTLGGDWMVEFERQDDLLLKIVIKSTKEEVVPTVIYGGANQEPSNQPIWIVWSPDGNKLALRIGQTPRHSKTEVFRLVNSTWQPVKLPEFYPEEKLTMEGHGFQERDNMVDAEYWHDSDTLVVSYFGSFVKEDEGDGWHQMIAVKIGDSGKAEVTETVDRVQPD